MSTRHKKCIFISIIFILFLYSYIKGPESGLYEISKRDSRFLNSIIISCEIKSSYGHFTTYRPPLKHDRMEYKFSELLNSNKKIRFYHHDDDGQVKEKSILIGGKFKIENIQHDSDKISSVRLVSDHGDKVTMDIELFYIKKECRAWIVYDTEEGLIQGLAALEGTFSIVK